MLLADDAGNNLKMALEASSQRMPVIIAYHPDSDSNNNNNHDNKKHNNRGDSQPGGGDQAAGNKPEPPDSSGTAQTLATKGRMGRFRGRWAQFVQ